MLIVLFICQGQASVGRTFNELLREMRTQQQYDIVSFTKIYMNIYNTNIHISILGYAPLRDLFPYWATRPCAVSVEECSVGRRTWNAGLEMKNI
jgi:hypothetical protein